MTLPKYTHTISRERMRQLRKNERGLCSVAACERKISKGGRCRVHALEQNERSNRYYWRVKRKMTTRRLACSKCGETGHNKRRCPS